MTSFVERLIGRLPLETTHPPDDGHRRAAVAAIVHDAPPFGARVLLMKRIERAGDPWSGHISLPGGGYQHADGDLRTTAIRETHEELGIDVAPLRFVGGLPMTAPFSSGPLGVQVWPFVFAAETAPLATPGPEAVSAFWLPLGAAAAGELDGRYVFPGTDRALPAWIYEGHTVWGLTWRILGDLLAAGRADRA